MGTNPEISQHYPKTIALDETLVQTGRSSCASNPAARHRCDRFPCG